MYGKSKIHAYTMSPKTLKTPIEQDVCTQYVSFLSNRYANKHYSISTDQTLRLNASRVRLVMNVWLCTYALVKRLDPAGFLPDLESLLTGAFLPPCPILALDWFKPGTVCSSFGSANDVFRSSRSPQSSVFFFFLNMLFELCGLAPALQEDWISKYSGLVMW